MDYIVFVKNKTTGCIKSDTIKVNVYPDFSLKTHGDTVLCPYETGVDIHALATPGTNFTYKWSPDAGMTDPTLPDQVVHPVSDTMFYVLAHRDNGCWKKDSVKVQLYQAGLNLGVSHDTLINEGDFAILHSWGANRFVWKNGNQEIATVSSISVSPRTKTTYMVYGYDACFADSLSVTVDVIPLEFFIPNLITPNGDGLNDNFRITNFGTKWNLEVYNRWGQLIYQKDKYINEWNGAGQSDGVYYYHITDTQSSDTYKGWVQIVR
jgi:gliding motility-associated-like protein